MAAIATIRFGNLFFHYSISERPETDLFDLHCHDCYEIYFFISGEGYYLIEGSRYELTPMSMAIVRPGEVHCFKSTGNSPYERYALHFTADLLRLDEADSRLLLSPFNDRELGIGNFFQMSGEKNILQIFNELTYAASQPENEKRLQCGFILGMLLTKILSISRRGEYRKEHNYSSELVTNVLRCINDNLTGPLTLDDIADRFYISKYHLSRVFKSMTGVSVIEYLIRKRVFLAQQLLRDGASAAEACARSGFGDYTSFYRAFRRITGCSPLEKRVHPAAAGGKAERA